MSELMDKQQLFNRFALCFLSSQVILGALIAWEDIKGIIEGKAL